METPTMAQLAESALLEREADIVFSLKRPIPAWMRAYDRPWEYLAQTTALASGTRGK